MGNQKMKKGKMSAATLILGIFLISGWALARMSSPKDLPGSLIPDTKTNLTTKRVDINGIAYQLYQMLMEAGRRNLQESARPVHVKSIFTVMNL